MNKNMKKSVPTLSVASQVAVKNTLSPKMVATLKDMGYKVEKISNSVSVQSESSNSFRGKSVRNRSTDKEERVDMKVDNKVLGKKPRV